MRNDPHEVLSRRYCLAGNSKSLLLFCISLASLPREKHRDRRSQSHEGGKQPIQPSGQPITLCVGSPVDIRQRRLLVLDQAIQGLAQRAL
jgi:hypothetical protein